MSFIHRFGAALNRHVHYPCCIIDGLFEPVDDASGASEAVRFRPAAELTAQAMSTICEPVRARVLRWFARSRLLDRDDAREMFSWENSGFSLLVFRLLWLRDDDALTVRQTVGPSRPSRFMASAPKASAGPPVSSCASR